MLLQVCFFSILRWLGMTSVHSWWFIFINLEKQDGPLFLIFKRNAVCLVIFGFAGSLLLLMAFFWLWWAGATLPWAAWASLCSGFSYCGAQAHGLFGCSWQALERGLSGCGTCALVALRHVRSSRTRDWTCVPCIGRWILIHCTTGEVWKMKF